MKRLFNYLENLRLQLSLPFLLLAILIALFNILCLFPIDEFLSIREYFSDNINLYMCLLFCAYTVYWQSGKFDKALSGTFTILVSDMLSYAVIGVHFSPVFILVFSFVISRIYKAFELIYAFCISLFAGVILSLMLALIHPFYYELLKSFAVYLSAKPSLFNVVDNIFVLFVSTELEDLVFNTGIGASMVINDNIVTGIKGVFEATVESPEAVVSRFFSGKYFVNISVALGLFLNVFSKLDLKQKATLSAITVISVIFGDNVLISLFLLLLNPIAYFGYLILIFVSNVVATLLDLRIGYLEQGSIFELFEYSNNILYFLIAGLIIIALSYFLFRMIFVKFDTDNKMFLPKDVKRILSALGGEKNIEKLETDCIYVHNPNLINILKLDCEVYSNRIVLLDDDLQLLKDYL